MRKDHIKTLIEKYNSCTCTREEREFLEAWYEQWNSNHNTGISDSELEKELSQIQANLDSLIKIDQPAKVKRLNHWYRYAAACIIIGVMGVSFYLLKRPAQNTQSVAIHDILPGTNKAILTLSNGKQLLLGHAFAGRIAQEAKVTVNQKNGTTIIYDQTGRQSAAGLYNTLTTPRGGQFQIVLGDGTKAWLNAASSIRYPVNFSRTERKVEITGEVYFEVAHNAAAPFLVSANGHLIQDVGTHFDVNCYSDEPLVKTTLLEGAVRIDEGNKSVMLSPGQQAQVNAKGGQNKITVLSDVDVEQVTGWKNGYFIFHDTAVPDVMRQVARWYDIEIVYAGSVPDTKLTGVISRNMSMSHVLDVLGFFKIKYHINDHSGTNPKKILIINQ